MFTSPSLWTQISPNTEQGPFHQYHCILSGQGLNHLNTLHCFTFDAGHLLAAGPAVEVDLTCDRLLHFEKVGQEQEDLHFMVGQVSTAADALGSLDVWPTQKDHSGPLVDIFWGESGDI